MRRPPPRAARSVLRRELPESCDSYALRLVCISFDNGPAERKAILKMDMAVAGPAQGPKRQQRTLGNIVRVLERMAGAGEGREGLERDHLAKLVEVGDRVLELLSRVGDLIVELDLEEGVARGGLEEEVAVVGRGGRSRMREQQAMDGGQHSSQASMAACRCE